jgi:hypothetical protein
MASPRLTAAAASTRRPEDVLGRRAQSIPCRCPFCGWDPLCATKNKFGSFVVGCENENCAVQPQVSDPDQSRAWRLWNTRPESAAREHVVREAAE